MSRRSCCLLPLKAWRISGALVETRRRGGESALRSGGKSEGRAWREVSAVVWWGGWMEMECCDWWSPAYMTLSKMMTLLSSVPGDMEVRDLMSGAMYSRWWTPHTGVVRWAQRCNTTGSVTAPWITSPSGFQFSLTKFCSLSFDYPENFSLMCETDWTKFFPSEKKNHKKIKFSRERSSSFVPLKFPFTQFDSVFSMTR